MKRLLLTCLIAPLAFAAAAQVETTDARVDAGAAEAEAIVDTRTSTETTTERDARRDCMRYTGSLILAERNRRAADAEGNDVDEMDRDDCVAANGRVYSREDLRRTGATDIADALRRLDPAIR
ncbi:hypothetical protein N799_12170 [Lysobacter arseniciresistens ZS79]|uniref:UrcA family protein n=1 Tax=Lysobacter arseniciresistens ZS79 TaxID=913325 RepID=A0A0A0F6G2_9GAMM|nr:hypothetical protein [Lysobacter arseniciresistens]KGM56957.1 hypothetical protein N799_12170 [Lysobacter arseniciresistens ZS79]